MAAMERDVDDDDDDDVDVDNCGESVEDTVDAYTLFH